MKKRLVRFMKYLWAWLSDCPPGLICILVTVLIVIVLQVFMKSAALFPFQHEYKTRILYQHNVVPADSTVCAIRLYDVENRQIMLELQKRVESLEQEEIRLIDDIRQETNNQINIVNGWISLWVGLLAFLGVLVPLALQFKVRRRDEKLLRDAILDIKREAHQAIEEMKSKMEVEVQNVHKLQNELNTKMIEYESNFQLSKLQNDVVNLAEITESRVRIESEACIRLSERLYNESLKILNDIIREYTSDEQSGNNNDEIMMRALVLMHEMVTKRFIMWPPEGYQREAKIVCDNINLLLEKVGLQSEPKDMLKTKLNAILQELYKLNEHSRDSKFSRES